MNAFILAKTVMPRTMNLSGRIGDRGAMKIRKRCENCHKIKSVKSFYKSQKAPDGFSVFCISCHSIKNTKVRPASDLISEIHKFETISGEKSTRVIQEIENFESEFLSGHWDASVLFLGRTCEAHVFKFAQLISVSIEFPQIQYLDQLGSYHNQMSELVREVLVDPSLFTSQKNKLKLAVKKFIERTLSFSFELENLIDISQENGNIQDNNFAAKGIKKYYLKFNQEPINRDIKDFEKIYRDIMNMRNPAAHSPRSKKKTLRKKDIRIMEEKLINLIKISARLLAFSQEQEN